MKTPVIGAMVHYILASGPNAGQSRPAVIVRITSETVVHLQVFTDPTDDLVSNLTAFPSAVYSQTGEQGKWRWPEDATE